MSDPMPAEPRGPRLLTVRGAERGVGWALRAANGRQLAVGVRMYRVEDELSDAISQLIIERAALRCAVAQSESRLWVWTAYLPPRSTRQGAGDAEPIARSARGYLRRDQCRSGVDSFLSGLQQLGLERRRAGRDDRWPW